MIEVVILAIALSMDAFAVSIGLGAKEKKLLHTGLLAGTYFGLFQALTPLVGYLGGKGVLGWIASYASWIAFAMLLFVGSKMIYESFENDVDGIAHTITHKVMLVLAVATSIDSLAAGFTLNLLEVNPFVACVVIGITTFSFSVAGVYVGNRSGTWFGSKAEFIGGVVLIAIGFKVLLF